MWNRILREYKENGCKEADSTSFDVFAESIINLPVESKHFIDFVKVINENEDNLATDLSEQ